MKKVKPGDIVHVYCDPYTETMCEGRARVISLDSTDRGGHSEFGRVWALVRFLDLLDRELDGDPEVERVIREQS